MVMDTNKNEFYSDLTKHEFFLKKTIYFKNVLKQYTNLIYKGL